MNPTSLPPSKEIYIFDFDSTLTQVEGLEELAAISLADHPDAESRLAEIERLTEGAMNGSLSFSEALRKRVQLLSAHSRHLLPLIESLKGKLSKSVSRNAAFFITHKDQILVISSGFKEFIAPVVAQLGITADRVYANTFVQDSAGNLIGCDDQNPLSRDQGKVVLLRELGLEGHVTVIGDGFTDYEMRREGLAHSFFAFTENVRRDKVVRLADAEAQSFDEFLFQKKLPGALSYPKNRIHILLLENIHPAGRALFEQEGYTLEIVKGGLDEQELLEKIEKVSILCIRSKTQVTARVLERAQKLMAIGAFCIGTNQIDTKTCQRRGIAVFNAPYSNTRSVVELAIGEMIMLIRNIPAKNAKMHRAIWDKSAGRSFEVRGKTLGLIGYGNIGTQFSVLAEALGMRVIFYDIVDKLALGNAQVCGSLEELLQRADVVSVHVDGRRENHDLIGPAEFELMKDGVIFLNLSRGHVVNLDALQIHLASGKVAGAGLDVFPYEPKTNDEPFDHPLRQFENVIMTPHIGGSTEEAQLNIGQYVAGKLIDYVNTGSSFASVNFPNLQLAQVRGVHRFIHIHENQPGVLARINTVLSSRNINIAGQYLKTNDMIGYVISDVDRNYDPEVLEELKQVPGTIRFRVLY